MSKEKYQERLEQINQDSSHIRNVCVQSQFADGALIADEAARLAAIEKAAADSPMFEGLGGTCWWRGHRVGHCNPPVR
ncbi:hypothetical protein [Aeromonas hydrophila]|uniref:hypothetical protein n=1 Tax=Aeromonas hydrophila TaxID=644 RepID=UPI0024428439|nr:hypothetical protein [Aeromonas hydrophila]